jgi:hypothetical protein
MVKLIHPGIGGQVAEVPAAGVGQWYASGWVPLTEENAPPEEAPAEPPQPITAAQAAEAAAEDSPAKPAAKAGKASKGE